MIIKRKSYQSSWVQIKSKTYKLIKLGVIHYKYPRAHSLMRALTVSVVALLAVVCIADEAIVCSTVLGKHNCFQDFDNCQWTG